MVETAILDWFVIYRLVLGGLYFYGDFDLKDWYM